jgi:hypothetical protein
MKQFILLSILVHLGFASFSQLSKEFKKIDSLHSYKNVKFGSSFSEVTEKMGLLPITERGTFNYTISNKMYLTIGKFTFSSGKVGFLFSRFKYIDFELENSDSKSFQDILDYFSSQFGTPTETANKCYAWFGENLAYILNRNAWRNNYISLKIMNLKD